MPSDSARQDLPTASAGHVTCCRGWPWTVVGEVRYGPVVSVRVVSRTAGAPDLCTLLLPFDRIAPRPHLRWRKGGRSELCACVAGWPTVAWPDMWVAAAVQPPLDVLPHQLVPVVALTSGTSTRLLLADAVGLGKTIEAGLVLAELASRAAADRVLVLTPASLRDQWVSELARRLAIRAAVVDRPAFESRRRQTPPGVAAFLPPGSHVLSIDLARQPDVLAALTQVTWDVLVVDEAHVAAGDSARTSAVREVAARARVVLLLSATPHSGDEAAFRRLCSLGRLDSEPPIGLVRSTRPLGRLQARRREIAVRSTPAERHARRLLASYLRLLERSGWSAARLTGIVLRKRALSCPAALASSLRHRLDWIARQPGVGDQPRLPFFDGELEDGDHAQPAVLRETPRLGGREREVLSRALEAANRAAPDSGKLQLLRRLLRRTRERAIVFTEYRDTLEAVAKALTGETSVVTLHGGLDRAGRAEALGRFSAGAARLLIATDVAAEGLNLQHACRLVVHFELPWSPVRLEQRDGRVDRIGQSRRVHLWRLVGARHHEARVLSALAGRAARIAAAGINVAGLETPPREGVTVHGTDCMPVDAGGDVAAAARDVILVRRLLSLATGGPTRQGRAGVPWRRLRRRPRDLARGVIVGVLFPRSAPGSRPTLRFVHVALRQWPPGPPSSWLPAVAAIASRQTSPPDDALTRALKAREAALLERAGRDDRLHQRRWQGSLFERRAARIVAAARESATTRLDEHRRRIAELETPPLPPTPVIALLVR